MLRRSENPCTEGGIQTCTPIGGQLCAPIDRLRAAPPQPPLPHDRQPSGRRLGIALSAPPPEKHAFPKVSPARRCPSGDQGNSPPPPPKEATNGFQIVQKIDGCHTTVLCDRIEEATDRLGLAVTGVEARTYLRPCLRGKPKLEGFIGPCFGGVTDDDVEIIRYEDTETYRDFSQ